jgi:hypothetical protein
MKWSRRTATVAGFALIVLTNVVALGGAAYNRRGEPESSLRLSERELTDPFVWHGKKENSGLELQLRWRVLAAANTGVGTEMFYNAAAGSPEWLDASKMASLGFSAPATPNDQNRTPSSTAAYQRQLPRDVLVVLELDGPAYQQALRRAAQRATELESKNERGEGKKNAQTLMDREEHSSSRLFAVDAGLDRRALRAKFPDFHGLKPLNEGQLGAQRTHFDATVAYGQRLEPWLVEATQRSDIRHP